MHTGMNDKCITNFQDPYHHHYHFTGLASSQSNFNCGPVCLLAELSCSCESTNNNANSFFGLTWSLRDLNMQHVGLGASFISGSDSTGTTKSFAEGHFIASVTSVTEVTITSVATGTVSQTIVGYFLRCADVGGGVVGDAEISIPGKFLLQTNTSLKF